MFKAGDKVVCVRGTTGNRQLPVGKKMVVTHYDSEILPKMGGAVRVEGNQSWWGANRFKLVEPEILQFTVGSTVERTGKSHVNVKTGQQYIVETLYKDELGGVEKVKLQGINACYHVRGFKVVAAPAAPAPEPERELAVGDQVFVVGKDYYGHNAWANNVEVYTISDILNHYAAPLYSFEERGAPDYIRKESLLLATGPKAEEAKARMAEAACIKAEKEAIEIAAKLERTKNYKPSADLGKALRAKEDENGEGGLVSYAYEYRDGTQEITPNSGCHANLAYMTDGVVGQFIYGLNYEVKYKGGDKPHHRMYYNYLLNDSPWAHCYLNKDVDDAMENDVQMNLDVHVNIMAGACVAMRSGTEQEYRAHAFAKFLEKGFLPNTCWLMANAVNWDGGEPVLKSMGGGHDVIDGNRNMDDLVKFFKQGYHLDNSPSDQPVKTHSKRFIIAGAIARAEGYTFKDWVTENIKGKTVGTGWNAKTVLTDDGVFAAAAILDKLLKD